MVSFEVTKNEHTLIVKIARRADEEVFKPQGIDQTVLDTAMDLSATIAQGVPLRLDDMLVADLANFGHDIGGIYRHLDRSTGKLGGFFRPRFAK